RSCGPTISRCVIASSSAWTYCSCSPNVAGPVGGAAGAALDVAGAAVDCEPGLGASTDGDACSARGAAKDPTACRDAVWDADRRRVATLPIAAQSMKAK